MNEVNSGGEDSAMDGIADEEIVEGPPFGLGELMATLVDLKTLPHVILLLILSTILYSFAQFSDTSATYSAIGFLSLSIGYAATAASTRWDFIYRLVRVDGLASESWLKSLILRSLRAWIVPLVMSSIIAFGFFQLTNSDDNWNHWLPLGLASLFLLWSIGQGTSFRSGTASWLAGKKTMDTDARSGGINGIVFWQLFAVTAVAILIGFGFSSGFEGELSENLKWIGFIALSIGIQIGLIFWIKDTLADVVSTRGGARFATRWSVLSQIFVTWHIASAWRRLIDEPSPFAMIIEELILMVITVLLAIWSLASRNVSRGGKLFTSNNALFWGLAFGFGYAGSIAMITSLSGDGNLAKTMAIGHIVTAITILVVHPFVLKKHAKNIIIPTEDEKDLHTPKLEITTTEEVTPLEETSEQQIAEDEVEEVEVKDDIDLDDIDLDEEIELLD
ncbi:MAG TPA: hypothetical protein HA340_04505 [Candidatus Thalassarchaeaceae archaeon]|nr:hypothetical protein [Candidatus Thalassarchaeaceae archaeon]